MVLVVFAGVLAFALAAWLAGRAAGRLGREADDAGDSGGLAQAARELRAVQRGATPSTAMVRCPRWVGAGFFVAPELLVTNAHVLCDGRAALDVELTDGRRLRGRPLRIERALDLATVEVPGAAALPLPLGDATSLAPGSPALAIGSPFGAAFTGEPGLVTAVGRAYFGLAYIELDADVAPGSSGGPLLDAAGRVVGVVSAVVPGASGVGLALPVNYAYAGDAPLVEAPPEVDAQAWALVLSRAADEDRAEVRELAGALYEPGLVAAAPAADGSVDAVLLQRFAAAPRPSSRAFALARGDRTLCRLEGRVDRWTRLGSLGGRAPDVGDLASRPDALWKWLDRTGLARDLWVGVARLDLAPCPPPEDGDELTLSHGEPTMDRVPVQLTPDR